MYFVLLLSHLTNQKLQKKAFYTRIVVDIVHLFSTLQDFMQLWQVLIDE